MHHEVIKHCPSNCEHCCVHPLKMEITGGLDENVQKTLYTFSNSVQLSIEHGEYPGMRKRELCHKKWYYCEISGVEWYEEEIFHKGVIILESSVTDGRLMTEFMAQGELC